MEYQFRWIKKAVIISQECGVVAAREEKVLQVRCGGELWGTPEGGNIVHWEDWQDVPIEEEDEKEIKRI